MTGALGYIDLSKRRVSAEEVVKCEEKFAKAKAVSVIFSLSYSYFSVRCCVCLLTWNLVESVLLLAVVDSPFTVVTLLVVHLEEHQLASKSYTTIVPISLLLVVDLTRSNSRKCVG